MKSLKIVPFIAQHIDAELKTQQNTADTCCAFTGEPIVSGANAVVLKSVIKPATANLADTFRYPSNFVLPEVAACFGESRLLRGNLHITQQGIFAPMVSGKSAKNAGRPAWTEIFQNHLDGKPAVFILTDETKRRLWIDGCVTDTKDRLRVFLNEGNISNLLTLRKNVLLDALEVVLECLHAGFSKQAIKTSLYSHKQGLSRSGLQKTKQLEISCNAYRTTPEFRVATFIGTIEE